MARVNFSRSVALRALQRQAYLAHSFWSVLRWTARFVVLLSIAVLILHLLDWLTLVAWLISFALLLLGVSLGLLVFDLYLRSKWSAYPDLPSLKESLATAQSVNLADYLDEYAAILIQSLRSEAALDQISARGVFFASFVGPTRWLFDRLGLQPNDEEFKAFFEKEVHASSVSFDQLLSSAAEQAIQADRSRIDDLDLVLVLYQLDAAVHQYLKNHGITDEDILLTIEWLRRLRSLQKTIPFWQREPGVGIAESWTTGYTPFLARIAQNLTEYVRRAHGRLAIFGRQRELNLLTRGLAKSRGHNLLLVGSVGVGRESLIWRLTEELASGRPFSGSQFYQVLKVDLTEILTALSDPRAIETHLMRIFHEAEAAGNTILFLPDIHLLVGGGDRLGGVNAVELLVHALRSENLYIIASTTPEEFEMRFAAHATVANLFERIDIAEPERHTLLQILQDASMAAELESGVYFTQPTLRTLAEIASRYVHDQPSPQNALNLLAESASAAEAAQVKLLSPDFIRTVLSEKLKVPLKTAQGAERDKLLEIEEELHKTVVGQDEAISQVANALRRARAGLATGARPIATFLFLGPTGVGKTETAKSLARVYFGSEDRMIRFDMSEYSQPDSMNRLVGVPGAAGSLRVGGLLTDSVHDQPFSLILLDEFEKAHPQIHNLFLQVFDDGRLTDAHGRVVDFTNVIIIATSNAGSEFIRQSIAATEDQAVRHQKLLDYLQTQGIYRPELLNRFDGVIAFHPLDREHVAAIVRLMLASIAQRLELDKQISVTFSDELVDALAEAGFDPQFGARPIRRLIQDKVESTLANMILTGQASQGGSIILSRENTGL